MSQNSELGNLSDTLLCWDSGGRGKGDISSKERSSGKVQFDLRGVGSRAGLTWRTRNSDLGLQMWEEEMKVSRAGGIFPALMLLDPIP